MNLPKLLDELLKKLEKRDGPKLTKEDLLILVKNKVDKLKIIDDETALIIVARELGIKFDSYPTDNLKLNIIDLIDGLKNINITCYIEEIDYISYNHLNETKCYVRLKCSDDSGLINVHIKGKNAKSLINEGIYPGTQLTLYKCYVKSNNGLVELHLGKNGHVSINSDIHKEVIIGIVYKIVEIKRKEKLVKSIIIVKQLNSNKLIKLLLLGEPLEMLNKIKRGYIVKASGVHFYNGYFYVTRLNDLSIVGHNDSFYWQS